MFVFSTRIVAVLILLGICGLGRTQQLPQYTQIKEMHGLINPAALSHDYILDGNHTTIGLSSRVQWIGDTQGPRTHLLKVEHLTQSIDQGFGWSLGGYLVADDFSPTKIYSGVAKGAGVFTTGGQTPLTIALGFYVGALNVNIQTHGLNFVEEDSLLTNANLNSLTPDIGIGLFFTKVMNSQNRRILYGGISVPQILGSEVRFEIEQKQFFFDRVPHFFGQVGYIHTLNISNAIEVSTWMKKLSSAPFHSDINVTYHWQQKFWISVGGSTGGSFHSDFGFYIKMSPSKNSIKPKIIRIGVGFDHGFGGVLSSFGSSYEVHVTHAF